MVTLGYGIGNRESVLSEATSPWTIEATEISDLVMRLQRAIGPGCSDF